MYIIIYAHSRLYKEYVLIDRRTGTIRQYLYTPYFIQISLYNYYLFLNIKKKYLLFQKPAYSGRDPMYVIYYDL